MNRFLLWRLSAFFTLLLALIACTKEPETIVITTSTFTDSRDGYVYRTVTINENEWFAQNLAYLPFIQELDTAHFGTASSILVYRYYGGSVEEAKKTGSYQLYGCLYKGGGYCPDGWHLSTDEDWMELERLAEVNNLNKMGSRKPQSVVVKFKSTTGWKEGENGTDDFGLALSPGGSFFPDMNNFGLPGVGGNYATSSMSLTWVDGSRKELPIYRGVGTMLMRSFDTYGFHKSIRCVRDK